MVEEREGFPSQQYYERISQDTGFEVSKLERVYRLTSFLGSIEEKEVLKNLALKGGTAINLVYFDFPRLSVDIDLNYVGSLDREEAKRDQDRIAESMKSLGENLGYGVTGKRPYAQHTYFLKYPDIRGIKSYIKVEINFMYRESVPEEDYRILNTPFPELEGIEAKVLKPEELFASKLAVLVEKERPRDLYDAYRIYESNVDIDWDLMRKCFVFYATFKGGYRNWKKEVELSRNRYCNELKPFLSGDAPSLKEVVKGAQKSLDKMLELSAGEREYIKKFYDEKSCIPSILFGGEGMDRLKDHPQVKYQLS